jgi:hypothetical protein
MRRTTCPVDRHRRLVAGCGLKSATRHPPSAADPVAVIQGPWTAASPPLPRRRLGQSWRGIDHAQRQSRLGRQGPCGDR